MKVDVRPSPVRKEVEMKPKTPAPPKWPTHPNENFKKDRVQSKNNGELIRTKFGICMAACVKMKLFKGKAVA